MHNMLQILEMAPEQRTTGYLAADGIFILTATLFFYCGHQFGLQRNGPTVPFPGSNVQTSQDLSLNTTDQCMPTKSFASWTRLSKAALHAD